MKRLALVGAVCLATVAGVSAAVNEYELKAAFLLQFTKFVEWPQTAFTSPTAPFVIGVIGVDPFGSALENTFSGKNVNARPFQIRRLAKDSEIPGCHILFISRSEKYRTEEVISPLRSQPILTVSEADSFCQKGGMINLDLMGTQVKLELNSKSAESAGLKISAKLQQLAKPVGA